jgi:NADPH-dependent 2,4-dienoyl-CoA reductase/sulfur reductase-like enzyme/nitrite reductase/ring-hydroxylating ferredoxin subunit
MNATVYLWMRPGSRLGVTMSDPAPPDLTQGIPISQLPDGGMLAGQVAGEAVLLARRGNEFFAIGATCTHYGGPLAEGLMVGDTVRCPWHHACFSLWTGEPQRAPALDVVSCWRVEQKDGKAFVRGKLAAAKPKSPASALKSIVIVGGGGAGNAAAEMLRREGYSSAITMFSADDSPPCDRPNLSKGYLAGHAGEDSIPLRPADFYQTHRIDLRLRTRVAAIDTAGKRVRLEDGSFHSYDALLLATGAEPVKLDLPGSSLSHVHYLRTASDARALVAKARTSKRAVVIGASFIGLEVAASLRAREVAVDVVAPDAIPMEKILGRDAGSYVRKLHEEHGVTFHLGTHAASIDERAVTLQGGERLEADLVVVGIGVRPAIALAEQAGLAVDRGVLVNEYLETSVPGIFAAGDIARWPYAPTGERVRIEHWVVAERQGQTAARHMLGQRERFAAAPFFWTDQYDFTLAYVGHAESWDTAQLEGQLEKRDCAITFRRAGKVLAFASVYRDQESLRTEVAIEG